MRFRFLLADPRGDIELSSQDLDQPFLISPVEKHPFLTLKDYFGALQEFILATDCKVLRIALAQKSAREKKDPADFTEIIIRSEKHGAYYHIASITLSGPGIRRKFAVTTAVSQAARQSLREEFFIMQKLGELNRDLLPELFCRESVTWPTDTGEAEFFVVLGEWLNNYHEWHLSLIPASGEQKVQLWDYEKGFRFLTDKDSYIMLRHVARILTCCYDQASFCQIYPWHHGAGDFVVRAEPNTLSVKLITARQYEPLVHFEGEEGADRLVAAIHFLLNLCLRIRLDRIDGVGEPAWLDASAVHAAVAGFFAGLHDTEAAGRLKIGPLAEFLEILRAFDPGEISNMYESLLAIYAEEDEADYQLIRLKLPEHCAELYGALQSFSLGKQ